MTNSINLGQILLRAYHARIMHVSREDRWIHSSDRQIQQVAMWFISLRVRVDVEQVLNPSYPEAIKRSDQY